MRRQGRAAPTQEAGQIARPSKGRWSRGFRIGCVGDAGRLGADRPPLAAARERHRCSSPWRKDTAAARLGTGP